MYIPTMYRNLRCSQKRERNTLAPTPYSLERIGNKVQKLEVLSKEREKHPRTHTTRNKSLAERLIHGITCVTLYMWHVYRDQSAVVRHNTRENM
jgi:hypothetical protein